MASFIPSFSSHRISSFHQWRWFISNAKPS
jgi:hypothetical protein